MRIYRPKIAAFVWLLGLLALGIAVSRLLTSDWLETGFLALLPATEQQPEIARAVRRHIELINGKVICLTLISCNFLKVLQEYQYRVSGKEKQNRRISRIS